MTNDNIDAAAELVERLRADLLAAMRAKQPLETASLRMLVSAIDQAQAVPDTDPRSHTRMHKFGDGASEVPRRHLSAADLAALLAREVADRNAAAAEMERVGRPDQADRLRGEAAIIAAYHDAR